MVSGGDQHAQYRVGFVMEQAMGHVTHCRALAEGVARDPQINPVWIPVHYRDHDLWQRLPGVRSNMSMLLGMRARRALAAAHEPARPFDALFFHTQLTALLSQHAMRRSAAVISLDATPLNADPLPAAATSGFERVPDGAGPWDRLKYRWYRRAFSRATGLIAWSNWARQSLIDDYGIDAEKVTVIPPGVDLDFWHAPPDLRANRTARKPRLLFVGVDFDRKGGDVLMTAFRERFAGKAVLDLVSPEAASLPPESSDVHVHLNLSINTSALRQLFHTADLFVLPTHNDCTPLAVLEAMASGLPVIASDVGAIREQVVEGVTGLLVRPGDAAGLADAIAELVTNAPRRRAMGAAGRERVERLFSARINYARVLGKVKDCVDTFKAALSRRGENRADLRPRRDASLTAGGRAWASES